MKNIGFNLPDSYRLQSPNGGVVFTVYLMIAAIELMEDRGLILLPPQSQDERA